MPPLPSQTPRVLKHDLVLCISGLTGRQAGDLTQLAAAIGTCHQPASQPAPQHCLASPARANILHPTGAQVVDKFSPKVTHVITSTGPRPSIKLLQALMYNKEACTVKPQQPASQPSVVSKPSCPPHVLQMAWVRQVAKLQPRDSVLPDCAA